MTLAHSPVTMTATLLASTTHISHHSKWICRAQATRVFSQAMHYSKSSESSSTLGTISTHSTMTQWNVPMFRKLTVRTRNCTGTRYRFTPCRMGQMVQLVRSASQYMRCSFSLGLFPSSKDILDKKTPIIVGAQTSWSVVTRAAIVLNGVLKEMRFCKKRNHLVATGPNTTAHEVSLRKEIKKSEALEQPYHHHKEPSALCESYHGWKGSFVQHHAVPAHLRQQIDTWVIISRENWRKMPFQGKDILPLSLRFVSILDVAGDSFDTCVY